MTTTQLFAELLVIGIGAGMWLAILLAAILGYRFDQGLPKLDTSLLVVLGGAAYAIGIAVDRLARALLKLMEKAFAEGRLPNPEEIERSIIVSSEPLARQIQYNRSRLRICRAWALNLLLTLLAFVVWNFRVDAMELKPCLIIAGILFLVVALMGGAAWALSEDHDENLRASDTFIKQCALEQKNSS